MSTTWSTNLGIALIGTGEQAGTWGATTNTNLGTLIEQAISGYATQAITDGADTTITIPNGATGVARNMFLELTGALTANRNLIVPANKKLYFIYNNTTGGYAVTVKVSGQTGVSVPNGKKLVLVSDGTDVFVATNHFIGTVVGDVTGNVTGSLSGNATNVTGIVAIANGGTGQTNAANAINAILPSQAANSGKFLTTDGSIVSWGIAGGDVSGPASAVDNAITRFNTTTGKSIQNSTVYIDDSGNVTIGASQQSTYKLQVSGATTLFGDVTLGVSSSSNTTIRSNRVYYNFSSNNLDFYSLTGSILALSLAPTGRVGVNNASPSATLDVIGTIAATSTISSGGFEVGYRRIPRIGWTGGTATTDVVGKAYGMTVGGITIPASVFAEGDAFSLFNDSSSSMTITRGAGLTMYLNGTDKNVTIQPHCMATVWFNSTAVAVITGSGLS